MTEKSTSFDALRSEGTTMQPSRQVGRTPQQEWASVLPQFKPEPAGLVEWLGTPEARQYEGQWVLLNDDFGVIDNDHSPTVLLQRNRDIRTPLVVFVDPPGTNLAV
jgi:hypothetical protein